MSDPENKKNDFSTQNNQENYQLDPKKDKDKNAKNTRSGDEDTDDEDSDTDDSSDGDFDDKHDNKNTSDTIIDDDEDEPHYIKIIKDDAEFDGVMDDENRVRLLSNTRDDLIKTDRKISEIIGWDGQQEKDLLKFEAEKEVKKTVTTKKELKQQRARIDIARRVTDLFFGNKGKIPSNSIINNQKQLLATGLTANDVTVKDKQLKHKVEDEKHHHSHHDKDHHNNHEKLSFADKIRQEQQNHGHGGGRDV